MTMLLFLERDEELVLGATAVLREILLEGDFGERGD